MDGKFHTNANRSNKDDHRYGTKLDANQPHHAEQLHCHQRQHQHLVIFQTIIQIELYIQLSIYYIKQLAKYSN